MTQPTHRTLGDGSLIDLLDRLVETGVVATGDVLLGLADVDLIRVNLQLVLGAVDTLAADDGGSPTAPHSEPPAVPSHSEPPPHSHSAASARQHAPHTRSAVPATTPPPSGTVAPAGSVPALRLDPPPDRSDLGIGGLLVAVIEIVHQLLERQAIHRMERGSLTSDQIERLGQALMALDQRVSQLIEMFNPHSAPALPVTVTGLAR